jgi:hypothetical protein
MHLSNKISQCRADTGVLIKYFPENPEPGQGLMFDLGAYITIAEISTESMTGRRNM